MLSSLDRGVLTQTQAAEIAFNRLITDILQLSIDHPISQALLQDMPDEKSDIGHVLTMQEDEIDSLTYAVLVKSEEEDSDEEDDGESEDKKPSAKPKGKATPPPARTQLIPLHRGHKRLIKVITAYSEYRQDQGSPILDDWSDVTPEDFNNFRMRGYNIYIKTPRPSRLAPPGPVSSTSISSHNYNFTKAEQFKKGMKRDPTDFKVFKDKSSLNHGIAICSLLLHPKM